MLQDTFHRPIRYLRLSLTEACPMRCVYCRPAAFLNPRNEDRLSPDEIEMLVRYLVERHGLRKIRLTGGDPTNRPDLVEIIRRIAAIPAVLDLAMTTNGLTLARYASAYAEAGLKRVNISLDTLDREKFARLTGVDGLLRVLAGIDAARQAGLDPIKLNCVVVRGENDTDLVDLVRFGAKHNLCVRFIELMPMGPLSSMWADRYVPERHMRAMLRDMVASWQPLEQGHDAARRYRVRLHDGSVATIGFITPMSCNFCCACDRIRIGANGALYPCLMDEQRGSVLPALRPFFDRALLDAILVEGLTHKRAEHPHDGFVTMTRIGG